MIALALVSYILFTPLALVTIACTGTLILSLRPFFVRLTHG